MKALIASFLLVTATGCAAVQQMQHDEDRSRLVTVTGNPDTVRSCARLGAVAVGDSAKTPFGGGPSSTADIPHWLRVKGAQFGGDTVLMTGSGMTTVGEIYKCGT
jgi:hypothetical protein